MGGRTVWRAVAIAAMAVTFAAESWAAEPNSGPAMTASGAAQIQALVDIKRAMTPAEAKIDSELYLALLHRRNDPRLARLAQYRFQSPERDNRFAVDVDLATAAGVAPLLQKVASLGGVVRAKSTAHPRVNARVRLEDVEALAAMPEVRRVRLAIPAVTYAVNTSEGDLTHGAQLARTNFGVTGAGVKVCVISDGVDSLAALQASGDLPAVEVLPGLAGNGSYGSAALEVIHDLAPGASLAFATGLPDEWAMAATIDAFIAEDCDIIVDDIGYVTQAVFEDGPAAQAVDAAAGAGILYFSAAGDSGNKTHGSGTWEGDFLASAATPPPALAGVSLHDFGDNGQSLEVTVGTSGSIYPPVLIWAEPYGAAAFDFDLYLMDAALANVVSSSLNEQNGDDLPVESVAPPNTGERFVVANFGGTTNVPMFNLWAYEGRFTPALATSGATRGHSSAAGAMSVGATPIGPSRDGTTVAGPSPGLFNNTNEIESFSSDGPRRIIFDTSGNPLFTPMNGNFRGSTAGVVRQKPDITAADGVSTVATPTPFGAFYGTSAAGPHAAAIAALLKSAVPSLTVAELRAALVNTAIDIGVVGPDRDSGAGIVMAGPALQSVFNTAVTGTKTVSGTFSPGGTITYTVTLTNSGRRAQADNTGNEFSDVLPATLTLVSATAPAGTALATVGTNTVTWNGALAGSGGTVTITINATVKLTTGVGATVSNQGTINYDSDGNGSNEASTTSDDPGVGGANNPTSFVVTGGSVVTATKTVAGTLSPGGTVTYTITMTNSGTAAQADNTGNELLDVLPTAGLTLVSATATAGTAVATVGTNTVTWNGAIPVSGSVTVTITATAKPGTVGTTVTNQATINHDSDANGTNDATTTTDDPAAAGPNNPTSFVVTGGAIVTGVKTVAGTFSVGGTVTYTTTMTNSGTAAQADNTGNELLDVLPTAGLTLVSATASAGTAVATVGTNTVTWNGAIPVSGSVTVTITATVKPGTVGTTVTNQATINYDTDANGTNDATTTTDDPAAAGPNNPTSFIVSGGAIVTGVKTVAGTKSVGGTVTYTITMTNSGTAAQADNTSNELLDVLPTAGLTLVSATASAGTAVATVGTNTVTWNGAMPASGSVTVTITATVKPGTVGTTVTNQATINYDADANGTNEASTTTDDPAVVGPNNPTSFVVTGGNYSTVEPCRALDTRSSAPIAAQSTLAAILTGAPCGIPSTATAVSLNATVTESQAPGFITMYPGNQPQPTASMLNFGAGQTRANSAVVPVATDGSGSVLILNGSSGTTHLIIDVNGYFE